ncbi:hypothetical protein [Maribacter cobaltidurans]|uniref:Uncharacterized protein n=1 Tax=Maribacter cobaltidurans TaxID=1178778 RepID=A0A223V361_9FLAO|nr:hypothetical protein [Maribacter cobaltidurans]ASV29844.1 hypothetical protein CJ263_06210 [Maribacter cobaltidurans]GGD92029.1 hypothetical protein GCM10011412_32500 [Maribacter cobaltidurans]
MGYDIKKSLSEWIEQALQEYGLVIACLIIGMLIGWYGKLLFADRKYNKQIQKRFDEKDERIAQLNFIVHEKLNKITVPQADKDFFRRVKRFFKKFASKK